MANNPLLREFLESNSSELVTKIVETFEIHSENDDEVVIEEIKQMFNTMLEARL